MLKSITNFKSCVLEASVLDFSTMYSNNCAISYFFTACRETVLRKLFCHLDN